MQKKNLRYVKSAKASLFPSLSFSTGHNLVNRPYQETSATVSGTEIITSNSNTTYNGSYNLSAQWTLWNGGQRLNMVNRPYQETSATVSGTEIITSNSNTTYNGSYNLSAQWTLWNGGQRLNNLKQQKTNKEIAGLSIAETENMLQEEITKLFVQILYANESVAINKNTLEVSEATYKRAVELFNEGSLSKSDVAQLEAQASNDKYQLVTAESSLRNYKLQLKQLLELDGTTEMILDLPELNDEDVMAVLPSQIDVYNTALTSRPEIQSSKLSINNAKLGIKTAKAGYLPTISMAVLPSQIDVYNTALTSRPEIQSSKLSINNAKLGIKTAKAGYLPTISLSASTSSMTNNASTNNCAEQMKYGWNNMIGINLSIPIFNNRQTESAVHNSQTPVAPLIFISLIENAFKHGISPTGESFIKIIIEENEESIICTIQNSNHPKTTTDKSGSGIGLEQVSKRLELLYAGRYEWKCWLSDNDSIYNRFRTICHRRIQSKCARLSVKTY